MSGAKNKAKDRQTRKHALYYDKQYDVTKVNKTITLARHVANNENDKSAKSRLAQVPAIERHRAVQKTNSERIKKAIAASY